MVNRFIKSGLFRGISYFLVFLLSFNAVFLGFTKKAQAEVITGPPVVVAASLLIAAGLSFTDTDSIQSAVQQFQNTNTEGWAMIEAAAGAAYAYGSVYNTAVSDSLWENVIDYVDVNFVPGPNNVSGFSDPLPVEAGLGYQVLAVAGGALWEIRNNEVFFNGVKQRDANFQGVTPTVNEFKQWSNGIWEWKVALPGIMEYAAIWSFYCTAIGVCESFNYTATGDAAWLDSIARELDWGPEGPNNEPPQKKIGFPWPLVGATGVSLTLDQLLDRLLDTHAPDVKNGGPGISEQPYNPPTVDPENPPLDRPSSDAGWLENIWAQMVATKTAVITLSKTVSDFIVPPAPVSVNLEPLKLTGVALTNVFPFSLPWDLARSMNPFYTTSSFVPILSLGPFNMPGVGACTWAINLSNWSPAVALVRAMELLFFDIGLVLLTRKLMGGAV